MLVVGRCSISSTEGMITTLIDEIINALCYRNMKKNAHAFQLSVQMDVIALSLRKK